MIKFAIRIAIVFGNNQWELVITPLRWRLGLSAAGSQPGIDSLQLFIGPVGFFVARGALWEE